MTRVRIKKEQFGHRYIYGKNIIEDEGREWGDVSTSWGMTKDVSKPSETRREALNRFFFTTLIRNQPCWYLDLIFQTPELWVKKLLLFKTLSLWYFIMRALENKHNCLIELKWFPLFSRHNRMQLGYSAPLVDGLPFTVSGTFWILSGREDSLSKTECPFSSSLLNSIFTHPWFFFFLKCYQLCVTQGQNLRTIFDFSSLAPHPHILSPKSCHFYFLRVSQISLLLFIPDATTPCELQLSLA